MGVVGSPRQVILYQAIEGALPNDSRLGQSGWLHVVA